MSAPVLTKGARDALASQVADDEVQRIIVRASIIRAALAHIDALEAERDALLETVKQANDNCFSYLGDIDALKARVAVLAAECRAIRAGKLSIRGNHAQLAELRRAQQQTDAAGALEGVRS